MRAQVGRARRLLPAVGTSLLAVTALLTLIPIARMVSWIIAGTPVQRGDYWYAFDINITDNGWLRWSSLFTFENAHLLAVPKLVYFANIKLFAGSNITLGLVVVGFVLAQVLLLWYLLPRRGDRPEWLTAIVAIAIPMLLFAPNGAWNFLASMSGTAWLLANLLIILAVVAVVRGNRVIASLCALVATITYGTGLTAWVAVLVVSLIRDLNSPESPTLAQTIRRQLPLLGAAVVNLVGYLLIYSPPEIVESSRPGLGALMTNMASVVGGIFTDDHSTASWIGGAALVALVVLVALSVVRRTPEAAPWIGLASSALVMAGLIGLERNVLGSGLLHSRYNSVAALVWITLLVLATFHLRPPALPGIAIGFLALSVTLTGMSSVHAVENSYPTWDRLATAQRLGVEAGGPWLLFDPFPDVSPRLERLGHYPFNGSFDADCGLLGADSEELSALGATPVDGSVSPPVTALPLASGVMGWLKEGDRSITCIIATGATGEVVGIGHERPTAPDSEAGTENGSARFEFEVLVPIEDVPSSEADLRVWVRFDGSDDLHPVEPG